MAKIEFKPDRKKSMRLTQQKNQNKKKARKELRVLKIDYYYYYQ